MTRLTVSLNKQEEEALFFLLQNLPLSKGQVVKALLRLALAEMQRAQDEGSLEDFISRLQNFSTPVLYRKGQGI